MNLAIDFLCTAPQDTKQGHHYGLYSLKGELKTALTALFPKGALPTGKWSFNLQIQRLIHIDASSKKTN